MKKTLSLLVLMMLATAILATDCPYCTEDSDDDDLFA